MSGIRILRAGSAASLDPIQSGMAHGYGVFETMRLSGGRLGFWDAHWERLTRSAQALGLPCDRAPAEVLDAVRQLVRSDALETATIKLSLLKNGSGTELLVYARPSNPAPERVTLRVDRRYPIHERSLLAGHKTHNYLENIRLLELAREAGFTDAVRLDTRGHLAETTMANLFWLTGGELYTPSPDCGILPGVVRAALLGLRPVAEGAFAPEVLNEADTVFLTNASVGLLPVDRVEGEGIAFQRDGSPEAVEELRRALAAHELECSVVL